MEIVTPIPTRLMAQRPVAIQVPVAVHPLANPNAMFASPYFLPVPQSNFVTTPPQFSMPTHANMTSFFQSQSPPPPPQTRPSSACSYVSDISAPLSPNNIQVEPRHVHHYKSLTFCGYHGQSSPLNRIRMWRTPDGTVLYDCVCGKRVPNGSLQKVKRHAYRHAVSSYTCQICGKVFAAHWSLNAHCRIHKTD